MMHLKQVQVVEEQEQVQVQKVDRVCRLFFLNVDCRLLVPVHPFSMSRLIKTQTDFDFPDNIRSPTSILCQRC